MVKKNLLLSLVIIFSIILAACGSKETTQKDVDNKEKADKTELTYEQIIDKAKEEGKLVVYGSSSPERFSVPEKAFEEEFGINVEYIRAAGGDLANRVNAEFKSKKVLADVVFGGDHVMMENFNDSGFVEKVNFVSPETAEEVNKLSDIYTPVNLSPTGIVYDSTQMEEPKSWEGLLDPKLKGKIGIADPSLSNTLPALFLRLKDEYGEEFLKKFGEQVVIYDADPLVANNVVGKELIAGLSYSTIALPLIKGDASNTIKYTQDLDVTAGPMAAMTLLKERPNTYAGLLFMNWSMTIEGQKAWNGNFMGITALESVEVEGVSKPPAGYEVSDYKRAAEEKEEILELFNANRK
jgi:iron(III) transport system substrate-binding protein